MCATNDRINDRQPTGEHDPEVVGCYCTQRRLVNDIRAEKTVPDYALL